MCSTCFRLAIRRQDLLARAVEFLRLKEAREVQSHALLQGATSALQVHIGEDGSVKSQRLDLLLSPGSVSRGVISSPFCR